MKKRRSTQKDRGLYIPPKQKIKHPTPVKLLAASVNKRWRRYPDYGEVFVDEEQHNADPKPPLEI